MSPPAFTRKSRAGARTSAAPVDGVPLADATQVDAPAQRRLDGAGRAEAAEPRLLPLDHVLGHGKQRREAGLADEHLHVRVHRLEGAVAEERVHSRGLDERVGRRLRGERAAGWQVEKKASRGKSTGSAAGLWVRGTK